MLVIVKESGYNKNFTQPFLYEDFVPNLSISRLISCLRNRGNLSYEYNPLRNFRYLEDYDQLDYKGDKIIKYALSDFDTDKLNFSLKHPVEISCQHSYDGSVNLILNDGLNKPKLINTRFSTRNNNTYEIVDRIGSNDTNIYDYELFDLDTSLYKRINNIPKIQFIGIQHGGKMPVGNYNFYFKYCDADGNETDFVGETGSIVCHVGSVNDPKSIRGGLLDENSDKLILLCVSHIDSAYNYITIYYTRQTSDGFQEPVLSAKKINRRFKVRGSTCFITIDGFEKTIDIPISDINTLYFIANKANTLAICLNRLFIANLGKASVNHLKLADLSLRMLPYYNKDKANDLIGKLNLNYEEVSAIEGFEYYNVLNIYNYLGYWDEEIYRLGVVYIMNDDSLSPVFNIRGRDCIPERDNVENSYTYLRKDNGEEDLDNPLPYDEITYSIGDRGYRENAKGVIRINDTNANDMYVYSLGIHINLKILSNLKLLGVKGLFFVRLKRIPTILALAFVIGHDINTGIPLIKYKDKYYSESFIDKFGNLNANYKDRLFCNKEEYSNNECAICPEFELRLYHFNNIFTDTEFVVKDPSIQIKGNDNSKLNLDVYLSRHYYSIEYLKSNDNQFKYPNILAMGDGITAKRNEISKYSSSIGDPENITIFKCVGKNYKFKTFKDKEDYNNCIVRGNYGPFLGISGYKGKANQIINIYIPGYSLGKLDLYFLIRYEDSSPFYAISDRYSLDEIFNQQSNINYYKSRLRNKSLNVDSIKLFRGDCYVCNYTHRLNRNFQDPEVPNADIIVDEYSWRDNFNTEKPEDMSKINRGDVNAVLLGSWITVKLRSNINLSMRDLDYSYPDEASLTGVYRTFYPLSEISTSGNYKIPESSFINLGISSSTSLRFNLTQPEVPYLKNIYSNRIAYSDIAVNEAFKNGFRVFPAGNFQDYQTVYGGITKLVELSGNLLCVMEHGIILIPVNERVNSGNGPGGTVFVNSTNVLPKNVKVVSDTFGSQWGESVLKTDLGVYGVDTVAKKIWRTDGNNVELISDGKVLDFLNKNITLEERELTPIIGIRNVKTHYNSFKHDVMFTFYDNMYGFEDKAWNLCFNEILNQFLTFYSWLPSYSASIDNIYFTFNRDTSKNIAKLGTTSVKSNNADGVVLDDVTMSKGYSILSLKNRSLPNSDKTGINYTIRYVLHRDIFGNYKNFEITGNKLQVKNGINLNQLVNVDNPVILLNIEAIIDIEDLSDTNIGQILNRYKDDFDSYFILNSGFYKSLVAIVPNEVLNNMGLTPETKKLPNLNTDFWKHGLSGIIDIKDRLYPCLWYGKLHPFELEFIVNVNPDIHKTFDLLQIISNKAEPDSFHYEIIGDCFDFADDKLNIYVRQELTKYLYLYNGCDITYDREVLKIPTLQRLIFGLDKYDKSTIFPLYYSRLDTINSVYDYYKQATAVNKDYSNLSGTEIYHYNPINEFRICNHVKAVDIKGSGGRLRGNMDYLEDKWRVLINPIVIKLKNETKWENNLIPISIGNSPIPNTILEKGSIEIPSHIKNSIDLTQWLIPQGRSEVKLKDKFIKIKIIYKGDKLAIISGIRTLFRITS